MNQLVSPQALQRVVETEGISVTHLVELAVRSEQLHNRDLVQLALQHALNRLTSAEPAQLDFQMVRCIPACGLISTSSSCYSVAHMEKLRLLHSTKSCHPDVVRCQVSTVLRHLISVAGSRAQARPYFIQIGELLSDFSASNVCLPQTETDSSGWKQKCVLACRIVQITVRLLQPHSGSVQWRTTTFTGSSLNRKYLIVALFNSFGFERLPGL